MLVNSVLIVKNSITRQLLAVLSRIVFKEQSPCPSVLLDQTKPKGFSPRVL